MRDVCFMHSNEFLVLLFIIDRIHVLESVMITVHMKQIAVVRYIPVFSFLFYFFLTDETQTNLAKHLLKTVCTDITNLIFNFLASDSMMTTENYSTITSEVQSYQFLFSSFK